MLTCTHITNHENPVFPSEVLTLDAEQRQKTRFKGVTDNGKEIGVFLKRGTILRNGDLLACECGTLVQVRSRPEPVVTARTENWEVFSRACYHLGNRHVALQIGPLWMRFKPDHVLENLVHSLGLEMEYETLPFEPEQGAYGGHHHNHP
jgi:urease accessory protein